jgi:hypothetical protein
MIDVWGVLSNGLWVVGLAGLLAVWSWARYAAHEAGVRPQEILRRRGYVIALDAGLLLFVAGMASTEDRWWARILWAAIGVWVVVHAVVRFTRSDDAHA